MSGILFFIFASCHPLTACLVISHFEELKILKVFDTTRYLILFANLLVHIPGEPLVFQAGYHSRKRTFKTHPKHVFLRDRNRSLIHVFACVFLNLSVILSKKFANMTKNTPFFSILPFFASLNDVCAYIA